MQQHASTVDLRDGERNGFGDAQAAGVDDAQTDAVAWDVNASEQVLHFGLAEDRRQLVLGRRANEGQSGPVTPQRTFKQKLDATDSDGERGARELTLIAKVEEVVA